MTTWLEQRAEALSLSSKTAYALQLCMEEAVTNVISYAFDPGAAHEIQIRLWRDGDVLLAEITDDGRPFDPLSYEAAPMAGQLDSVAIGGLGIKLMRGFARHIAYRRSGVTNHLMLSFPGH
jgi:anti-sigma regulatory factor (Ser/Thr protein kinase)